MSNQELDKVATFRERVKDVLYKEDFHEDQYLLRWLRARNFDIPKAEEMLRAHMKWREEYKIDSIMQRTVIPEELKKVSPMAFLGVTEDGYGAFLAPWGRHDMRAMLEKFGLEKCEEINRYYMEMIASLMKTEGEKVGKKVTQMVEVCDFEGYSYRQMANKQCREFMARMQMSMEANYPEILQYCLVINAPKFFAIVFQMMKPFMSKETLEKIEIMGPDKEKWMKVVREKFPVDKLPKYWGGNLETTDEYASGHEIWIQGPENLKAIMNGLNEDDADFTVQNIASRDKFVQTFDITEPGTLIEWRFKTNDHDIGFHFQLKYKSLSQIVEDVIPYARVDAQDHVQEGSHICDQKGIYIMTFDNSFSKMTAKTLLYIVNVVTPDEQKVDEVEFKECI